MDKRLIARDTIRQIESDIIEIQDKVNSKIISPRALGLQEVEYRGYVRALIDIMRVLRNKRTKLTEEIDLDENADAISETDS